MGRVVRARVVPCGGNVQFIWDQEDDLQVLTRTKDPYNLLVYNNFQLIYMQRYNTFREAFRKHIELVNNYRRLNVQGKSLTITSESQGPIPNGLLN